MTGPNVVVMENPRKEGTKKAERREWEPSEHRGGRENTRPYGQGAIHRHAKENEVTMKLVSQTVRAGKKK